MPDLSRRQWLARIAPTAVDVVLRPIEARVQRHFPPQRRPPGAQPEVVFRVLCTACGDCSKACPHDAIFTFNEEAGANAGTPVMIPDRTPCHMCEGLPCAVACRAGALEADGASPGLGVVEFVESRCIATAGPDCGACANLCPGETDALAIVDRLPVILPDRCVGCGLCIEACPVDPAAISLLPL